MDTKTRARLSPFNKNTSCASTRPLGRARRLGALRHWGRGGPERSALSASRRRLRWAALAAATSAARPHQGRRASRRCRPRGWGRWRWGEGTSCDGCGRAPSASRARSALYRPLRTIPLALRRQRPTDASARTARRRQSFRFCAYADSVLMVLEWWFRLRPSFLLQGAQSHS
jgi:hypothetical protein